MVVIGKIHDDLRKRDGNFCIFTGEYVSKNKQTAHHIIPKRQKIDNRLSNLVLADYDNHQYFHNMIERYRPDIAAKMTDLMLEFKKTRDYNNIVENIILFNQMKQELTPKKTKRKGKELDLT